VSSGISRGNEAFGVDLLLSLGLGEVVVETFPDGVLLLLQAAKENRNAKVSASARIFFIQEPPSFCGLFYATPWQAIESTMYPLL
jgi:hypothetical protein